MDELGFVADLVEEQVVKGNLRWLANFNEVRKEYVIGDIVFPVYASGGLQEKGFFLSRIYSALVTPKYRIHLLLHTSPTIDPKFLRRLVIACKSKFGIDDWVFLALVQSQPFDKNLKDSVASVADKNVGIAAYSLASKENVFSNNVLGKGLTKQLKLTEPSFEAFDIPNYLKSFTIVLFLGVLTLIVLSLSGIRDAVQPLTLIIMIGLSFVVGHRIYKSRYHTTLSLSGKGFQLKEGSSVKEGKWSDYDDVTIFVTPRRETCLRLYSNRNSFDLPISRTGISRREAYDFIKLLIRKK